MDQEQIMLDDIVEALEDNLQFWRSSPTDSGRHFAGPEVLHLLAWTATSLALPIFLSATNEIVKDKLKTLLHRVETNDVQPRPESKTELAAILDNNDFSLSDSQLQSSSQVVGEYLSSRGWPKALARHDAEQIVAILKQRLE